MATLIDPRVQWPAACGQLRTRQGTAAAARHLGRCAVRSHGLILSVGRVQRPWARSRVLREVLRDALHVRCCCRRLVHCIATLVLHVRCRCRYLAGCIATPMLLPLLWHDMPAHHCEAQPARSRHPSGPSGVLCFPHFQQPAAMSTVKALIPRRIPVACIGAQLLM
jgi:hypothetical protein